MLFFLISRCSAEKVLLKFHKIYSKKHVPATYNFKKIVFYGCLNFVKLLRKDTFFNRKPPVVASVFFF